MGKKLIHRLNMGRQTVVRFERTQRVRHFSDEGLEPEEYECQVKGHKKRYRLIVPRLKKENQCWSPDLYDLFLEEAQSLRLEPRALLDVTSASFDPESFANVIEEDIPKKLQLSVDRQTKNELTRLLKLCAREVVFHRTGKDSEVWNDVLFEDSVSDETFSALKQLHLSTRLGIVF